MLKETVVNSSHNRAKVQSALSKLTCCGRKLTQEVDKQFSIITVYCKRCHTWEIINCR